MDLQDDQLHEASHSDPDLVPHIFNNLLQEDNSEQLISSADQHSAPKEEPENLRLEGQAQDNLEFNLRTIEKEDLNCFLPPKSEPDEPEEDPLHEIVLHPKPLHETTMSPRRISQISKTAYLQETRADKIARYREKKQRRVWWRKISYDCRKIVADKRERKNGRFVKKEEGNMGVSSAKSSWQTKQGQVKEECSVFKVQDYYQ